MFVFSASKLVHPQTSILSQFYFSQNWYIILHMGSIFLSCLDLLQQESAWPGGSIIHNKLKSNCLILKVSHNFLLQSSVKILSFSKIIQNNWHHFSGVWEWIYLNADISKSAYSFLGWSNVAISNFSLKQSEHFREVRFNADIYGLSSK